MAAEIKLNSLKMVRSREDSSSKGKGPLILNKKKILETSSYKQIVDSKQKSVATDSKSQVFNLLLLLLLFCEKEERQIQVIIIIIIFTLIFCFWFWI